MLNHIWLGLLVAAVLAGGFQGRFKELVEGGVKGGETAVTLSIGLIGIMSMWLGLMRLADKSGLVQVLARALRPVLVRLFPGVPAEHPAMGSMVMNIAANMLGLNNAATPLGLRAMKDLETLNPHPGVATNAMCTFLAINTGSVQLIPMTAVGVMAASGSNNPSAIIGTAFLGSVCSTTVGILTAKWLEGWKMFQPLHSASTAPAGTAQAPPSESAHAAEPTPAVPGLHRWGVPVLCALAGCFLWFFISLTFRAQGGAGMPGDGAFVRAVNAVSILAVPFLVCFFPLYAALRGISAYEEFVEGAKEGFQVAIRIMPFLVAMLVAIGMFRSAGGVKLITEALRPVLQAVGFPPELLPMALMRPLSGSGTFAIFTDIVKEYGPDHFLSRAAGTIFGSTETTFYVIAVYFGSVAVKRTRHAVPAGLMADAAGMIGAIVFCRLVFG
jgi:spore maturation protein SpmA